MVLLAGGVASRASGAWRGVWAVAPGQTPCMYGFTLCPVAWPVSTQAELCPASRLVSKIRPRFKNKEFKRPAYVARAAGLFVRLCDVTPLELFLGARPRRIHRLHARGQQGHRSNSPSRDSSFSTRESGGASRTLSPRLSRQPPREPVAGSRRSAVAARTGARTQAEVVKTSLARRGATRLSCVTWDETPS